MNESVRAVSFESGLRLVTEESGDVSVRTDRVNAVKHCDERAKRTLGSQVN